MSSKTTKAKASCSTPDRVDVITFGVGHGDCLLVEFIRQEHISFRLLYDGGASKPEVLIKYLKEDARPRHSKTAPLLDIVVLSHVDDDHQGGLHALLADDSISIGELWLPCLPAFERLSWLFADSVATAVTRAKKLEEVALKREISVIYPIESHVERFVDGGAVTVSVISPARQLLKRLYVGNDLHVEELLSRSPLPLEWLIRGEGIRDADGQDNSTNSPFDGTTALSRALLPEARRPDSLAKTRLLAKAKDTAAAENIDFAPEFFGNSVLNDTSLVIVIDAVLDDIHRRRIVMSGDQENWSYISSQHPMGLGPDVLKVPHHGGRVYLSDVNRIKKEELPSSAAGQFFIWMRPRIAIVSAKGTHNLPRTEFREAARSIGTTLICPNKRSKEIIYSGGTASPEKSCYHQFGCGVESQHDMLRLSMSALNEELNAAACLQGSGHRGPAPVVVMQQRLIEPDESFVRWTSAEVRKQAHWLERFLRRERASLLEKTGDSINARLDIQLTTWERIVAEAKAEQYVQFVANPEPVLRYAAAHGLIWAKEELRWAPKKGLVAALSETEYKALFSWLRKCQGLLLPIDKLDRGVFMRGEWFELIRSAYIEPLIRLCAAWSGLPYEVFKLEVEPRLIRDIQLNYSGRLASLDRPRVSGFAGSGANLLHLYSKNEEVQDFFASEWLNSGKSDNGMLYDKRLSFILDSAQKFALPPLESRPGSPTAIYIDLERLYPFVEEYLLKSQFGSIQGVQEGVFPERFANVFWEQLWRH